MSTSIAVMLVLTGCAATSSSQTSKATDASRAPGGISLTEKEFLLSDVGNVPGYFDCAEPEFLQDDLYSIARMKGFDCSSLLGFVTFRVYESRLAMLNRVHDWRDLVDQQKSIVAGNNWFAYGDHAIVNRLADRIDGIMPSESGLPPAPPISDEEGRRRACNIVVVSAVRGLTFDGSVEGQGDVEYDEIFAGLMSVATEISQKLERDRDNFEYEITLHAEKIRDFCAGV